MSAPPKSAALELDLLHEVARLLNDTTNVRDAVTQALRLIVERSNLMRATITLLDPDTHEIFIEEAYGLSTSEQFRGRYKLGEGITGQVVESGEAIIVPRVNEHPDFLNRTGARTPGGMADISFVCVPLVIGSEVVGALSVDSHYDAKANLHDIARVLHVVGAMVSQGVALRRKAANAQKRLQDENARLQRTLQTQFRPENIVGNSKAMIEVYGLIEQVADTPTTVLITGESGTGKELVAHAIHYNSSRRNAPFVRVNCGALPENIVESELFGHEKGSFTGATQQRKGRFEQADGGTIFLDEVGELSPATQVKLLRVLQERELERVGGNRTIKVDVRVITATSQNLEAMIESGRFRLDLYYRLNVFPILMPPLRDRGSDVLALADHFVAHYNRVHGRSVRRIATSAIDMLTAYHWPGNVRELENCIERAVLLANESVLHGHHLPPSLQTAEATGTGSQGTLDNQLDNLERVLILDALKSTRGNMTQAAKQLGITERVMGLRVKKHAIDPGRFKVRH
jgi:Nif-specific regulatory protein